MAAAAAAAALGYMATATADLGYMAAAALGYMATAAECVRGKCCNCCCWVRERKLVVL